MFAQIKVKVTVSHDLQLCYSRHKSSHDLKIVLKNGHENQAALRIQISIVGDKLRVCSRIGHK